MAQRLHLALQTVAWWLGWTRRTRLLSGSVFTFGLAFVLAALWYGYSYQPVLCAGICAACYCDEIQNGQCIVNGRPNPCVGCVGNCVSENNCLCQPGQGGCGNVIQWCRSEDCRPGGGGGGPRPTPTPTPPPCSTEERIEIREPVVRWEYEPNYPIVVGQDPEARGFDIIMEVTGGEALKVRNELKQVCMDGSGYYPDDCPGGAWEWKCEEVVLERYDDPVVEIKLAMRLGDSSVAFIEEYLASRYYGARRQDALPKVWPLYENPAGTMSWDYVFEYKARDPGIHGGRIFVKTKGTPLNPEGQEISVPYEVPVYLIDSTLDENP